MAISQQAVRAAIRTTAHQDAHHVHVSTTDSVHVRHLLTERRRTKADSAPKDSEQDFKQVHHSALLIVHDITTPREATTHRASSAEVISSEAATSRAVAEDMASRVVADMGSSAEDISSEEVMASNKMDITSRRVDSIHRTSAVDSSSVAATSKAVVADMASSAEDISSEAATSRAVAEDMASSVADSASTLLAMTPMQNIA